MARKSKASRWVFYLNGPRATKGKVWWVSFSVGKNGCAIAIDAGVKIPKSTFDGADAHVSQFEYVDVNRFRGSNYTAILPLEV